jgi:hypothetical protein
MLDAQLVANAANYEIDHIVNASRLGVKRRHGWHHHGAGLGTRGQVAQLD